MRLPAFLLATRSPWLRYPVLGPPIGAAVFALYLAALGAHEVLADGKGSAAGWVLQFLWFGWPIFLLFGYAFGALPALLTAGAARLLGRRMRGWRLALALAGVGAAGSCVASWLFGQDPGTALRMAVCGAIAAGACALTGAPRA